MKRKNVCMVVYSYFPLDFRVRKAAVILAQHGYSVDVICLRNKNEKKEEIVNGVYVYRLPLEMIKGKRLRYFYQYFMFLILATFTVTILYLKKKYFVIHTHSLPDPIVFTGIFAKYFGAKLILDLHESMPDFYTAIFEKEEKWGFIYHLLCFLERISCWFADHVITVSDYIGEIIRKRTKIPKEKITSIYNVPEIEGFYPPKYSKSKEIFFAGLLHNLADIETVLNTLVQLEDFVLHIFGKGEKLETIKKRVNKLGLESRVIFHGYLPVNELREILLQSEWFIGLIPLTNTSQCRIGLGNKALELPTLGFAVVAADLPGLRSIFSDDCFFYYKPGDAKSLANAILSAWSGGKKTIEKIKKSQDTIKMNGLTLNDTKKRLLQLYEKISKDSKF